MKNLDKIFNPKTIAVIGANPREKSVGWGLMKNALLGKSKRKIFAVNPKYNKLLGAKCFPSVSSIKEDIDLAIIAVPAKVVPSVVEECCQKKVGGIIVISSGFKESGKAGEKLEESILNLVKKAGIPLIGPNCLGIIRPGNLLNATFAPAMPKSGEIAFISQSGALLDSVIDGNLEENYGFSFLASYGNGADISLAEFLELAIEDKDTKVIALYLEGISEGRKIIDVLSRAAAKKPLLVLKAGKTKSGKEAASSHTGSLAGDYQIYRALFKQTGAIEVDTVRELFSLAKALAWQPRCKNGIGIITNGGSCGVLLSDYCHENGVELASLSTKTLLELDKTMHPSYSRRNPLDLIGDALSEDYQSAIEALLSQPDINGLIIAQTLQIMTDSQKNAEIIVKASKRWKQKPIVTAFLGGPFTNKGVEILEKNRIPNYKDLKEAALAIKTLITGKK
jgi:acetyltransferase